MPLRRLPWDLPVIQAPVGPAATPALVAAVSAAGGLGTLAASWTEPSELRRQVASIKRLTDRPFAVNLVLDFEQEERLHLVLEEQVPVVTFSWGIERNFIARTSAAGATVAVQIGTLEEARRAVGAGADILITQGREAGGHVQGTAPLLGLLEKVRAAFDVPIAAAGGITDERSAKAALAAGATAIACGTAFLAASEADVHPIYRERLLQANGEDTILTKLFDVGWPAAAHRVIRNATVAAWEEAGKPPSGARPGEGEIIGNQKGDAVLRYSDAQPTSTTEGDVGAMALYAGAGVGKVSRPEDGAALTERLARPLLALGTTRTRARPRSAAV
jgi:NAD(P)H-dependent flavin oxidoreductase YrpB (nitropropane dioxygenase family)